MRKFRVLCIVLFLFGLSAFTSKSGETTMSAYDFMSRFNPAYAQQMSAQQRKVPITDIRAQGPSLAFRYDGVYLRFDFVGKNETFIKLNGIAFSKKEVQHSDVFTKAVLTKFGLRLKDKQTQYTGSKRSFASETTVSPLGGESYQAPETRVFSVPENDHEGSWGGVGESSDDDDDDDEEDEENQVSNSVDFGDSFESTEYRLFPEDAREPSTNFMRNRRQEMQLAYEMISGENQAGMLNFINGWMGGLNNSLANPNSPMNTFMRSGSQNPNSIEMPRYY